MSEESFEEMDDKRNKMMEKHGSPKKRRTKWNHFAKNEQNRWVGLESKPNKVPVIQKEIRRLQGELISLKSQGKRKMKISAEDVHWNKRETIPVKSTPITLNEEKIKFGV